MKVIKVVKKTNTKIDQLRLVIKLLSSLNDIDICENEVGVLAYYILYGINDKTDKMIEASGIVGIRRLGNIRTRLKDIGYLDKFDGHKTWYVKEAGDLAKDDEINFLIRLKVQSDGKDTSAS